MSASRKTSSGILMIIAVWLGVVLPQTLLGYGSDGDAWSVASAAERIWQTHAYVRSRTTGFPLFELAVTPMVHYGGWYLSNLVAAAGGLALLGALIVLAARGHFRSPLLSILAVAFAPLVVTTASSTMDYIPALACLAWAYVAATQMHWRWAAVLAGIACGFRPTSGLYLVPLAILVVGQTGSWRTAVEICVIGTVSAVVSCSPALI
jgi:hypothetical protein